MSTPNDAEVGSVDVSGAKDSTTVNILTVRRKPKKVIDDNSERVFTNPIERLRMEVEQRGIASRAAAIATVATESNSLPLISMNPKPKTPIQLAAKAARAKRNVDLEILRVAAQHRIDERHSNEADDVSLSHVVESIAIQSSSHQDSALEKRTIDRSRVNAMQASRDARFHTSNQNVNTNIDTYETYQENISLYAMDDDDVIPSYTYDVSGPFTRRDTPHKARLLLERKERRQNPNRRAYNSSNRVRKFAIVTEEDEANAASKVSSECDQGDESVPKVSASFRTAHCHADAIAIYDVHGERVDARTFRRFSDIQYAFLHRWELDHIQRDELIKKKRQIAINAAVASALVSEADPALASVTINSIPHASSIQHDESTLELLSSTHAATSIRPIVQKRRRIDVTSQKTKKSKQQEEQVYHSEDETGMSRLSPIHRLGPHARRVLVQNEQDDADLLDDIDNDLNDEAYQPTLTTPISKRQSTTSILNTTKQRKKKSKKDDDNDDSSGIDIPEDYEEPSGSYQASLNKLAIDAANVAHQAERFGTPTSALFHDARVDMRFDVRPYSISSNGSVRAFRSKEALLEAQAASEVAEMWSPNAYMRLTADSVDLAFRIVESFTKPIEATNDVLDSNVETEMIGGGEPATNERRRNAVLHSLACLLINNSVSYSGQGPRGREHRWEFGPSRSMVLSDLGPLVRNNLRNVRTPKISTLDAEHDIGLTASERRSQMLSFHGRQGIYRQAGSDQKAQPRRHDAASSSMSSPWDEEMNERATIERERLHAELDARSESNPPSAMQAVKNRQKYAKKKYNKENVKQIQHGEVSLESNNRSTMTSISIPVSIPTSSSSSSSDSNESSSSESDDNSMVDKAFAAQDLYEYTERRFSPTETKKHAKEFESRLERDRLVFDANVKARLRGCENARQHMAAHVSALYAQNKGTSISKRRVKEIVTELVHEINGSNEVSRVENANLTREFTPMHPLSLRMGASTIALLHVQVEGFLTEVMARMAERAKENGRTTVTLDDFVVVSESMIKRFQMPRIEQGVLLPPSTQSTPNVIARYEAHMKLGLTQRRRRAGFYSRPAMVTNASYWDMYDILKRSRELGEGYYSTEEVELDPDCIAQRLKCSKEPLCDDEITNLLRLTDDYMTHLRYVYRIGNHLVTPLHVIEGMDAEYVDELLSYVAPLLFSSIDANASLQLPPSIAYDETQPMNTSRLPVRNVPESDFSDPSFVGMLAVEDTTKMTREFAIQLANEWRLLTYILYLTTSRGNWLLHDYMDRSDSIDTPLASVSLQSLFRERSFRLLIRPLCMRWDLVRHRESRDFLRSSIHAFMCLFDGSSQLMQESLSEEMSSCDKTSQQVADACVLWMNTSMSEAENQSFESRAQNCNSRRSLMNQAQDFTRRVMRRISFQVQAAFRVRGRYVYSHKAVREADEATTVRIELFQDILCNACILRIPTNVWCPELTLAIVSAYNALQALTDMNPIDFVIRLRAMDHAIEHIGQPTRSELARRRDEDIVERTESSHLTSQRKIQQRTTPAIPKATLREASLAAAIAPVANVTTSAVASVLVHQWRADLENAVEQQAMDRAFSDRIQTKLASLSARRRMMTQHEYEQERSFLEGQGKLIRSTITVAHEKQLAAVAASRNQDEEEAIILREAGVSEQRALAFNNSGYLSKVVDVVADESDSDVSADVSDLDEVLDASNSNSDLDVAPNVEATNAELFSHVAPMELD